MAEKMLNRLINRYDNIIYLNDILTKTELLLLNEVTFSLKEILNYIEEPLDIIHSECKIYHNGNYYDLSCVDLDEKGNVVVVLTDETCENEFEIPIGELEPYNLVKLNDAVTMVVKRILEREIDNKK